MSGGAKDRAISTSMGAAHKAMNESRTVVNETLQAFIEEIDDLRSQVATLTAERDAARRERDEALANARDYERDADIAEAHLSVVTAERDRLKAALDGLIKAAWKVLESGTAYVTTPDWTAMREACQGARRALAAPPPTPPAGSTKGTP